MYTCGKLRSTLAKIFTERHLEMAKAEALDAGLPEPNLYNDGLCKELLLARSVTIKALDCRTPLELFGNNFSVLTANDVEEVDWIPVGDVGRAATEVLCKLGGACMVSHIISRINLPCRHMALLARRPSHTSGIQWWWGLGTRRGGCVLRVLVDTWMPWEHLSVLQVNFFFPGTSPWSLSDKRTLDFGLFRGRPGPSKSTNCSFLALQDRYIS